MMPSSRLSATFLLLALLLPQSVQGATKVPAQSYSEVCMNQVNDRLAREQRIYRGVLFGVRRAKDEPLGTTAYDTQGVAWLKMGTNKWEAGLPNRRSGTDAEIDKAREYDPQQQYTRRGIFETKGVLTSELVPPLTQSYRAFQCRILSLCEAVKLSMMTPAKQWQSVATITNIPGCLPQQVTTLSSCRVDLSKQSVSFENGVAHAGEFALAYAYCNNAADSLLTRESQMLKLAVSYDASYRSLLQLAGNMDMFLQQFDSDLLGPIRQSTALIGQLTRIPCFLSECND